MIDVAGKYEDDLLDDPDYDEELAPLEMLGRLTSSARKIAWFSRIGDFLSEPEKDLARACVESLGLGEGWVAPVEDWEDALYAAESPEINDPAWEVMESMRAGLTAQALDLLGDEQAFETAMTHLAAEVTESIKLAAEEVLSASNRDTEDMVNLLTGSAVQAVHLAALVLLAAGAAVATGEERDGADSFTGADEDYNNHPFILRFKLFEAGRWPITITGQSLHIL